MNTYGISPPPHGAESSTARRRPSPEPSLLRQPERICVGEETAADPLSAHTGCCIVSPNTAMRTTARLVLLLLSAGAGCSDAPDAGDDAGAAALDAVGRDGGAERDDTGSGVPRDQPPGDDNPGVLRFDAGFDAGSDAGSDAGFDAGSDAGRDVAADVPERPSADGPWVQIGASGRLLYRADAQGNVVPDFSNAGYRGGGVRLPLVPVRITLEAPTGDAGELIQRAIDRVSAMPLDASGVRGAVLLRRGTYRIAGSLRVRASGVVLRGEGAGTVLLATGATQRSLIQVGGERNRREVVGTRRAVTDAYVPVGARSLRVDRAEAFRVGDTVIIHRPSTAAWIHELGMDRIPPRPDGEPIVQWAPGSKDLFFDRTVTAVEGTRVTFDAPVMTALQREYGGASVYRYTFAGRIAEVGIESLAGDSQYASATDELHGWSFIDVEATQNAWVRDVTGSHFGYSLVLAGDDTRFLTVQDCAHRDPVSQITGGRRYTFHCDGCALTLWQRNRAQEGRHDFVTGATAPGPVVFLDGVAEQAHSESGPHHRWAAGVLYDSVRVTGADAALSVYNRLNLGSGHGWSGAYHVLWNSQAPEMRCESPPTAINWAIGAVTPRRLGACAWESSGRAALPASLYRAQLRDRLGPDAVRAIER